MNIYCISQRVNDDYDSYDSAVVCAKDEDQARNMHPNGAPERLKDMTYFGRSWVKDPASVSVRLIGKAAHTEKAGVICASFNAG